MTEKESQNQVWIGIKKDIEKLEKKFTDHMTDFQLIFEAIDKIHERLGYLEHPRIEVGLEEKAKSHTDQFVETIRELQKSSPLLKKLIEEADNKRLGEKPYHPMLYS